MSQPDRLFTDALSSFTDRIDQIITWEGAFAFFKPLADIPGWDRR